MIFLYWVTFLFVFIILGLLSFLLYNIFRGFDDPKDGREVENYLIQYTNGNSDGIIDEIELGIERTKITAYYWNKRKMRNLNSYKPEIHTTYHKTIHVEPIFFGNEDKIKAYPHRADLLPIGLLKTETGKRIAEGIEMREGAKDENSLLRLRLKNLAILSKDNVGAESMLEYKKSMKTQIKELGESVNKEVENKK